MERDFFGDLRLLSLLGAGGMGEVFLARLEREDGFRKLVALKRIRAEFAGDEDFRRLFTAEAREAARLNHPHVVQVFDYGRRQGQLYLIMEYIEGEDLERLLQRAAQRGVTPPLDLMLAVGLALCRALSFAHALDPPVIHGDVNPQNLLLGRRGEIKLSDFGLAALSRLPGMTAGKLAYLPPELARGRPPDQASDIFGVGAVLYRMAMDRPPLAGAASTQEAAALAEARPASQLCRLRPDLPQAYCRLVENALEPAPEDRYSSCAEMSEALERLTVALQLEVAAPAVGRFLEAAGDVSEKPTPEPERTLLASPSIRPRRWLKFLLPPLALLLATVAWFFWSRQAPRPPAEAADRAVIPPPAKPPPEEFSPLAPPVVETVAMAPPVQEKKNSASNNAAKETPPPTARQEVGTLLVLKSAGTASLFVDGHLRPSPHRLAEFTRPVVLRLEDEQGTELQLRLESTEKGQLSLAAASRPYGILLLDGRPLGLTPRAGVVLAAGRHRLRLSPRQRPPLDLELEFQPPLP